MSLISLSHSSMAQPLTHSVLWDPSRSSHCEFIGSPHFVANFCSLLRYIYIYIFIPIPGPALNYGTLIFMFKDQQRDSTPVLCQSLNACIHNSWVQTLTINECISNYSYSATNIYLVTHQYSTEKWKQLYGSIDIKIITG